MGARVEIVEQTIESRFSGYGNLQHMDKETLEDLKNWELEQSDIFDNTDASSGTLFWTLLRIFTDEN